MKKTYCLLMAAICLIGCSSSKQQNQENSAEDSLPVINLSENVTEVQSLPLSEAAQAIEIVPLEMTNQSLFSEISELEITSSDVWIQGIKEQCIYRFSRSGKFLNKVGKIGQGPKEYTGLWSFQIDEAQEEIYCLTPSSGILVYDYDGNFKRKATSASMNEMFTANNQRFMFYQGEFFLFQNLCTYPTLRHPKDSLWSVALTDTGFKTEKIFKNPVHIGQEELLAENGGEFSGWKNYWWEYPTSADTYQGEFTLKYPDCDTIYCYDKDSRQFLSQYAIHTQEPKGDYGETHQRFKTRAAFSYFTLTDYYSSRDYIYLRGYKGEEIHTYAYHKETGNVKLFKQKCPIEEYRNSFAGKTGYRFQNGYPSMRLWNDLCGCSFKISHRSSGKYWIDVIEPDSEKIQDMIEEVEASETSDTAKEEELLAALRNMTEDSNPLLIIVTLK